MSRSLAEALGPVDLEAGSTYRCQVKGRMIEPRVTESAELPPVSRRCPAFLMNLT